MSRGSSIRGRERELEAIDGLLASVRGGDGGVLIVQGREGLGVSAMLEAAQRRAASHGVAVRRATAVPGDRLVPLGQLVAAVGASMAPSSGAPRPYEDRRYRLLRAVEHQLRRLSEASPVLVCLDDLQWADGGTVASLGHLVRELRDRAVGWLLGARATDLSADLDAALEALRTGGARHLHLAPLESNAARDLTRDLLGVTAGPELAGLVQRCGGNPALIVALVDGLLDEGLVHFDAGRADLLRPAIPPSVCDIVRARLSRLAPSALEVARAAAALGATCTFAQLSRMTRMSPGALLGPLDELNRSGLLADDESGIAYREDVVRDAVLETLAAPVRRAVQRQAADVLLQEGGAATEIAARLIASGEDGHRDEAVALLRATRQLAAVDPAAAARVGEHALRLVEPGDPLHGTLAGETVVLLHRAGRHTEAQDVVAQVLAHPVGTELEGELRSHVAAAEALPGHVRIEAGRRGLALPGLTEALRSRLRTSLLHSLAAADQLDEAAVVADAVRADDAESDRIAGRRPGDPARRAHALAVFDHARGAYAAAFARLDEAQRRAGDDTELRAAIELSRVEALSMTEAPSAALAVSARRSTQARMQRRTSTSRLWDGLHGRQLLHAGRVADAVEVMHRHFDASAGGTVDSVADAAALTAFARAAAHLGAAEELAAAVVKAEQALASASPEIRRHADWLLASVAPGSRRNAPLDPPRFPADLGDPARMVRLHGAADAAAARSAVILAEQRSALNPSVGLAQASALHARGLLEHEPAALERAWVAFDAGERPLDAASALEDLAVVHAQHGDPKATATLEGALRRYAMSGAVADVDRLRTRLQDGHEPHLRGPLAGWERLTPTERVVAELVAGGLSNREVAERLELSPHTVSGHLRQVFAKLEVRSRLRLIQIRHGTAA